MMPDAIPNLHEQLFGRAQDVTRLMKRVHHPGLTAVVARPLMGKTSTLLEVQRRLLAEPQFLVGYAEAKGSESSHLQYAVEDLYTRWLANSTMREQAISMWECHEEGMLVPRIGQMVGTLFKELEKTLLPSGVGAVVKKVFEGLAAAQKDLLTGGMSLAPLPYDQALSLVKLVAKMSGRQIVLILDAWEKSSSFRFEYATLEMFLKHLHEWSQTHVFLALRHPIDSATYDEDGYRRVRALCRFSPDALLYELGPINQEDPPERMRLVRFVRSTIPAAQSLPDQKILDMVDGYPGVLDFWCGNTNRTEMRTEVDLRQVAQDAQRQRYVDLEHLLEGLEDPQQSTLAARLAFFPRLDARSWEDFREMLLTDLTDTVVEDLIDDKVLMDKAFPTFGHDTRHAFAQKWFIENKPRWVRRIAEQYIAAFASRVTGINSASVPLVTTLAAFSEPSRQVNANPVLCCLTDAARALVGEVEAVSQREFEDGYLQAVQHNRLFAPLIALALMARGFTKGEHGNNEGAIADFTEAIKLPGAPAEPVAQAFVNRGIRKGRMGDHAGAMADYTAAIALPGAPHSIVQAAREQLHLNS